MASVNSYIQGWKDYRPSKAVWLWSCAGAIAATMIIGFTWGGWVTGGTAGQMARTAAADARKELVATICVERFVNQQDAAAKLTALKDTAMWERDDFIIKGGWSKLAGVKQPVDAAAELCAERLMEAELPAAGAKTQPTSG